MPIDSLVIDVATGDDDLRPGSRAFVVLIGRDGVGREIDLASVPLNAPGEKFADRSPKCVSSTLRPPLDLERIEFVELRFDADRGVGDDKWHCSEIRVVGLPASDHLWIHHFPREDRLTRQSSTRRSLRLSSSALPPQLEFEMTTGDDDLRSDSGGIVEAEMADGQLLVQPFFGPFDNHSIHSVRVDLPALHEVLPVHRARLFFERTFLGGHFGSIVNPTTNDNWTLQRLRVRTSHNLQLVDATPGRFRSKTIWESLILRPKVLAPTASPEFLIEFFTGSDDLRTGGNPHSEVAVSLITRGGGEVPLQVRARPDQPFVAASTGAGAAYAGSFASGGVAEAVGRTPDGRSIALADIERVRVRMDPEVTHGLIGSSIISTRAGDRWSLAGIRVSVPVDGRAGSLRTVSLRRCLASFFNLGVTLDANGRTWGSPRFE